MRTNAIIRIIIWSLVIAILLGILGAVLALRTLDISKLIVRNEYSDAAEAPFTPLPATEALTFPADSIREIEIEWASGNIVILPADVTEIEVSESGATDEENVLLWHRDSETLELRSSKTRIAIGINQTNHIDKDLYIRVPMDWKCDSLEINAAFTNLEIQDLTIREMDINTADGNCDFIGCQITDLDIDSASGDVNFSGILSTLDFDAASASFIGDFRNTPSRIDMDSMSGSLDIALPENCGYTVSLDGVDTRFHSEFRDTENRNGSHIRGDGQCRIQVDGMQCDVTIRKNTEIPSA